MPAANIYLPDFPNTINASFQWSSYIPESKGKVRKVEVNTNIIVMWLQITIIVLYQYRQNRAISISSNHHCHHHHYQHDHHRDDRQWSEEECRALFFRGWVWQISLAGMSSSSSRWRIEWFSNAEYDQSFWETLFSSALVLSLTQSHQSLPPHNIQSGASSIFLKDLSEWEVLQGFVWTVSAQCLQENGENLP